MKPDAPEGIRGPHKPISSKADGIQVSEHLPKTAKIMDKVTLIRSMHHTMKNHNSAGYYALTGPRAAERRSAAARFARSVPRLRLGGRSPSRRRTARCRPRSRIRTSFSDGSVTPGQHASFLGKKHDPLARPAGSRMRRVFRAARAEPARRHLRSSACRRGASCRSSSISRRGCSITPPQARGLDGYYERAIGDAAIAEAARGLQSLAPSRRRCAKPTAARPTARAACSRGGWSRRARSSSPSIFADASAGRAPSAAAGTRTASTTRGCFPIIEKYHLPITEQTLPDAAHRSRRARPARRRRWSSGWASSAARRTSTRTSAATTGRSATPRCSPAAA